MVKKWIRYFLFVPLLMQVLPINSQEATQYIPDPSQDDCGAAISKNKLRNDNINQALACMQKGYTNVYWGIINDLPIINPNLKSYFDSLHTLEFHLYPFKDKQIIVYTYSGERKALLLKKYLCEHSLLTYLLAIEATLQPKIIDPESEKIKTVLIHLSKKASNHNPYIMGILLNYSEKDIKFFYQYNAYREYYIKSNDLDVWKKIAEIPLVQWPDDKKNEFDSFISKNKEWEKLFKIDKLEYLNWLQLNKEYTNDYLINYGKAFETPLYFLTNPDKTISEPSIIPEKPQIVPASEEPTFVSEPEKPITRWQQIRNALAAGGILAGLYATWRYFKQPSPSPE